jgi:hypothetical protein
LTKLLAGGCSWTDAKFKTNIHPELDCSWPKWPELVIGDWDEVVNIAQGGSGLDYMIPELMNYIMLNDDVSHIIIQISSWYRWRTPGGFFHNPTLALGKHAERAGDKLNQFMRPTLLRMTEVEDFFPISYRSIELRLNNYLILLNALAELCLYKDIKLIAFQGLYFANSKKKEIDRLAYKYFVRHDLFHKLDSLNNSGKIEFLNWPFVDTMSDCMDKILPEYEEGEYRISPFDNHPSEKGQRFIAEWINQNASTI